jgi:hypothetical protein
MDKFEKFKDWVRENAPTFIILFENKYIDMTYDKFGSLPPKTQKQIILGAFSGFAFLITVYILSSYLTLWSFSRETNNAYEMISLIKQYQRFRNEKREDIQRIELNSNLAAPGLFKEHLIEKGKMASISPKLMEVQEKTDGSSPDGNQKEDDGFKLKVASVKLQKVNLIQLKNFLSGIEFGDHNLKISSLKILNDDKLRGYMNVEMEILAYLLQMGEEG